MATLDFSRFASPEILRRIDADSLLQFLAPYSPYFDSRGVRLPPEPDKIPYELLADILISPDDDTPPELAKALYLIKELTTRDGMDILDELAQAEGLYLEVDEKTAPADVAVRVYLHDPDLLRRAHARQFLIRPRSYEYFRAVKPAGDFAVPDRETLRALARSFDDWFEEKRRGRACRVRCFPKGSEVWFLIQHGDPLRREGILKGNERSSLIYRPEKNDVLVYDSVKNEMWANAQSKGEKALYCEKIGEFLFGDRSYFSDTNKFTLAPLQTDGELALLCEDVEGLEWVKLREVEFRKGALTHILKARDLSFAFGRYISPQGPLLNRAKFQVRFSDSKTPRIVTIRTPNIAQYTRDSDNAFVEQWLRFRGFVQPRPE